MTVLVVTFDMLTPLLIPLVLILFIAIFIGIIIKIILSPKSKGKGPQGYQYQMRNSLLTNNELAFYRKLSALAGSIDVLLFAKVRLTDLINPAKGSNNWRGALNHIDKKHVDFVLCDKTTLKPLLVIELDDSTHDRPDRAKRDEDVDAALKSAGLPILHTRDANNLELKIANLLQPKQKARA